MRVSWVVAVCVSLMACQALGPRKHVYPAYRDNDADYAPSAFGYSDDDDMLLLDQPHSEFLYNLEKNSDWKGQSR